MEEQLGWEAVSRKFLEAMRVKGYVETSVESFEQQLKPLVDFMEGRGVFDARRVRKEDLLAYQVHWTQAKTKEGRPYRWGTLCWKTRVFKRLFEWLEGTGQVLLNPAEDLKEPPRGERRLPRNILTEEQAQRILEAPDLTTPEGMRKRAVLEVFYSTGIRLAELTHLKLSDVDFEGGLLRVNEGKGAKDRVVPLGSSAAKVLKGYIAHVRPLHLNGGQEESLFLNKWGKPLSKQMVEITVRECARKVGIPFQVTPHVFRHTFATQLVRNGAPVEMVSRMLGHSDLSVTHVYVRVAGAEVKKAHQESHPREKEPEAVPVAAPTSFKDWNHE